MTFPHGKGVGEQVFCQKSPISDFWCDYLYMIHNICKYFEFVSVHIQK